jgi:ATP-dependent exoDNAse (exonuclease V) beta subunit
MKGDLFISASAGTGKTYTISKRYLEIFEEAFQAGEEISVGEVAAITFTRKAAGEMKRRIVEGIREKTDPRWTGLLYSIPFAWIGTIDSFAGRILAENGALAGIDPGLRVEAAAGSSALVRRVALRTVWENEALAEPILRVAGLDDLLGALAVGVDGRGKVIAARPAGAVEGGLPLVEDPASAASLAEANRAFLELFRRFDEARRREMDRLGRTDFLGVLLALRDLLLDSPALRARLSGQFRYIIVDEFQDTDHLQKEIVDLLRGRKTRVVYVGDAKQSIYRFRGAEVEVFAEARREVEAGSGTVLELSTNYRSHPGVLDFANRLFAGIFDGAGISGGPEYSPVIPLPVAGKTGDLPRARILFHPEDEGKAAALFIRKMVGREFDFLDRKEDGSGGVNLVPERRKVRYRDFALLLRKLRGGTGDRYAKALREMGIPCYVVGEAGFFDLPEVRGLVSILKVLADPADDLAMTAALLSPAVGLDLQDLARLKARAKAKAIAGEGETDPEGRPRSPPTGSPGAPLFDALGGIEEGDLSPERAGRVGRLREVLENFADRKELLTPSAILEEAAELLDYEAHLALADPLGRRTANLRKLMDSSKALDGAGLSLREVIERLDGSGLEDVEPASVEGEETDAVKVMTVHKAKGLEFPIVIVAETSWSDRATPPPFLLRRGGDGGGGPIFTLLPEEKAGEGTFLSGMAEEERRREAEEEERSLYVAATRARDLLALTLSAPKRRGARPWRDLLASIVSGEDGNPEVAPAFLGVLEVVRAADLEPGEDGPAPGGEGSAILPDLTLIDPMEVEDGSLRISPTRLVDPEEHQPFRPGPAPARKPEAAELEVKLEVKLEVEMETGEADLADEEEPLEPKDLGRLAHQILESLGVGGQTLEALGSAERPRRPPHFLAGRFTDDELREVWTVLDGLRGHRLVREIEAAEKTRTEYQILRPFGGHTLVGRVDKLVKTRDGWHIVDFKFADSSAHAPAYEFQMKFYLYLAREIFRPMLGARLFYLKDGGVRDVRLEDGEVEGFEEELRRRIEVAKGR